MPAEPAHASPVDGQSRANAPAVYAIGDVQGCLASLQELLARIDDPGAQLWFAGDLVNRGPDSLGTLRFVRALGERAIVVLGNHDLHLLTVAAGARRAHRSDTIDAILAAPDRDELLDWLRARPLAHHERGHLLVHAGVLPDWTATEAIALAAEVQAALRGEHWREFLAVLYGDLPDRWDPGLRGYDRLRVIVNALTRLRFVTPAGAMDLAVKDGAAQAPAGLLPWFDAPDRRTSDAPVVFGHWSTLGLVVRPDIIALDSGCVWGGKLSAVRLADRAVFQVRCRQARVPGER